MRFNKQSLPKLTIITVCYNVENDIEQTLVSVLEQTYVNLEYIVIDGASKDNTVQIVKEVFKKYENADATLLSEPDDGIYSAMNKGIHLAKGEWVNFMNAGDVFYSNRTLENVATQLRDCDFACGIAKQTSFRYWVPTRSNSFLLRKLCGHNVNHQASFIKRSLLCDGYDVSYRYTADDMFFLKSILVDKHRYKRLWMITNYYDIQGVSSVPEAQVKIDSEYNTFVSHYFPTYVGVVKFKHGLLAVVSKKVRRLFYLIIIKLFIDK